MKKRELIVSTPVPTKKMGGVLTAQLTEHLLVINYWRNRFLKGRYAMDTETHEYGYLDENGIWSCGRLCSLLGACSYEGYWYVKKDVVFDKSEQSTLAIQALGSVAGDFYQILESREYNYGREKREKTENNRWKRVQAVMDKVPELPEGFNDWVFTAAGVPEYAFLNKDTKTYYCRACGKRHSEQKLLRENDVKKIRERDVVQCPVSKKPVQIVKRYQSKQEKTHAMILQDMDKDMSVARFFDVEICQSREKKEVDAFESVRIVFFRNHPKNMICDIYYAQWGVFDNKHNPRNRQTYESYLYPEGISQALNGTEYSQWSKVFEMLAAAGVKIHYNRLLASQRDKQMSNTIEYLFKGRFHNLMRETALNVSYWSGGYTGPLNVRGTDLNRVFQIEDTQKINRIRQHNGGDEMVRWMQWSDTKHQKIDEETLCWLVKEKIRQNDMPQIPMSPKQVMNYVMRQQSCSYPEKNGKQILSQWEDYLSMCRRTKKDLTDEMIYRPRELKRRHEQLVEEIRKEEMLRRMKDNKEYAKQKTEEMRKKFPDAENVLKEIRTKYEYSGEEFMVIVPKQLTDILLEGQALHHCCGSSDRYFDRIQERETYICFLRRTSEPKVPFYTLEIEPSGTIRQHRSYYDEEPGIDEIRGFLKEWQKVVKKRLTSKDKEYAKKSAVLREENIKELKEKRNLRVLQGLMEDFMEAAI